MHRKVLACPPVLCTPCDAKVWQSTIFAYKRARFPQATVWDITWALGSFQTSIWGRLDLD